MVKIRALLHNRNFILTAAVAAGLALPYGAKWSELIVLPALSAILTLALIDISERPPVYLRSPLIPAAVGMFMNYVILGNFLIGLATFLIHDENLWIGFVIMAAVPAAIVIAPLSVSWSGNQAYAVIGTKGAYIGALIIAPVIVSGLVDVRLFDTRRVIMAAAALIMLPIIASKWISRKDLSDKLKPARGTVINWCFFLILYTIVGLNHETITAHPSSLFPIAAIAFSSTFLLGFLIEWVGTLLHVSREKLTSLCLLGTFKNYGLAAGLALFLVSKEAALPAAVLMTFMIVYIAWLDFRLRRA
ncbi:MAG TPA: hypothetical protein VLZ07_09860 [Syntrophales bacterium]|nr:hypothetical protein [Syntrophales bacterium]